MRSSVSILAFALCLSAAGADVLRTVRDVQTVPTARDDAPHAFDVRGQVVSRLINEGRHEISIAADDFLMTTSIPGATNVCRVGDLVHLSGTVNRNRKIGRFGISASTLEIVGHRPLPDTVPYRQTVFEPDRQKLYFVAVSGVVSEILRDELSTSFNWITLQTSTGTINAFVSNTEYPLSELEKLIDAEVELRGVLSLRLQRQKFIGAPLELFGEEGISVVRPAPSDPFDAPAFSYGNGNLHRQLVRGTVRGVTRDSLFITSEDGHFITVKLAKDMPDVRFGDTVSAVGFAVPTRFGLQFSVSIVRRDASAASPVREPAVRMTARQLVSDAYGRERINTSCHGRTINVSGTVRSGLDETRETGVLRIDCETQALEVDVSRIPHRVTAELRPECTVDVTGVCTVEFESPSANMGFPRFRRFLVIPRDGSDIRILARPTWMTTLRLLAVIAVLALVIVAILIWNKSLKVLSERRGRELAKERIAHTEAEIKVEERTRLAVELHDSISQTITGIAFQVDSAITANGGRVPAVTALLDTAKKTLASCRKELQCCLWDLRCRTFEERDMTEAVTKTIEPHANGAKVAVRFNVPRNLLSESTTRTILQIVRELVVNAIRHGKANEIRIAGELRDGIIRFSVRDDGAGFDPSTASGPRQGHFGLHGIRERLANFDGTLRSDSSPGRGSRFTVTMKANLSENPEP